MDTQQELSPKFNAGVILPKRTWRDALQDKVMHIDWKIEDATLGYRIVWWLWSADIWFGRFPLLKFIVGVNILLWIVTIWINN